MTTAFATTAIPNTDSVATLKREDRRSAKKMARWFFDQYENGLSLRKPHAINWMKVKSIMRGIHYFQISRGGAWRPLKPKPGQIWAAIPLMKPFFRQELGRLNSNVLGVTTMPARPDADAILKSDRGYNLLTHWIEESEMHAFFDRSNQILLYEGMVGYHRYADTFRQNVFLKALPASELFPIPFDAKSQDELDGLMHVTLVTEEWLEHQDRVFELTTGQPPPRSMKDASRTHSTTMSVDFPIFGSGASMGGKIEGALAATIWMKPTELTPGGEYAFMLGDELFRYRAGTDRQTGQSLALPNGKIPVELVYYTKKPDDFWGDGFCEDLISMQLAVNRAMTQVEQAVKRNKPVTAFDSDSIDPKDVQDETDAWIPFRSSSIGNNQNALLRIPPAQLGREVGALLGVVQQFADQAAGFRSSVVFGQQEGRTESGTATQLLNANAQAPLVPVLSRIFKALERTYPEVLDMLQGVWPQEKTIRVSGPNNVGKELTLSRSQLPWSQDVIIKPVPLLPNGTNSLANILFQLKQVPGQDGTVGSAVSDVEFMDSLRAMSLLPPKIDQTDDPGTRMRTRINRLINDGQTPAARPAQPGDPGDIHVLENHTVALQLLAQTILDPSFESYSQQVQQSLMQEFKFHKDLTKGGFGHPTAIDDDITEQDARMLENFLAAAEQDLTTLEGEMSLEGIPVGLEGESNV